MRGCKLGAKRDLQHFCSSADRAVELFQKRCFKHGVLNSNFANVIWRGLVHIIIEPV